MEGEGEVEIIVDAWQNQRFKPLQRGWTLPFQGDGFPFSDISGENVVPCGEDGVIIPCSEKSPSKNINASKLSPIVDLPEGWEWSTEWKIDSSDTYGSKDSNGWSYGSSFENLYRQSLARSLDGNMGRMSIVRRRRWIRRRVCKNPSAAAMFEAEKSYILQTCSKIGEQIKFLDSDWKYFVEYEKYRSKMMHEIFDEIEGTLSHNVKSLNGMLEKLVLLKTYLKERAYLELQYAKQLEKLSLKWIDAGQMHEEGDLHHPSQDITEHDDNPEDVTTNEFSSSYPFKAALDEDSVIRSKGFFHTVCTASNSVARRLEEFSSLLTNSLYQDVESIIAEVHSVIGDCTLGEAQVIKRNLINALTVIESKANYCDKIFAQSRSFLFVQRHAISHSLYNISAAFPYHQQDSESLPSYRVLIDIRRSPYSYLGYEESNSKSNKESEGRETSILASPKKTAAAILSSAESSIRQQLNFIDSSMTNGKNDGSASTSSATLGANDSSNSGIASQLSVPATDIWLTIQRYRQSVLDTEATLFVYQAFVHQQSKFSQEIMDKVSAMLQATVKVFSYEQCRAWNEARCILESICSGNNSREQDSLWKDFGDDENDDGEDVEEDEKIESEREAKKRRASMKKKSKIYLEDGENVRQGDNSGPGSPNYRSPGKEDQGEDEDEDNDKEKSWRSGALDSLQIDKYVTKIGKVRFSVFAKSSRRHNSNSSTTATLRLSSSLLTSSSSNSALNDYEIPRSSIASTSHDALPKLQDLGDPHVWHDGVFVITCDAMLHIFTEQDEAGSHSSFALSEECKWTSQIPVISVELIRLTIEPSLVMFPGVTGDAFIIQYVPDSYDTTGNNKTTKNSSAGALTTAESQTFGKFSQAFLKEHSPLGVIVNSSSEMRSWIHYFGNPFFENEDTQNDDDDVIEI